MAKTTENIIRDYNASLATRARLEGLWQDCRDYYDTVGSSITSAMSDNSDVNPVKLYDTTGLETADILAAGMTNNLTPPSGKWFSIKSRDYSEEESDDTKRFLKKAEVAIAQMLARSNFYDAIVDFNKNSGVYGTAVLYSEEDEEDGIRFKSLDTGTYCIKEDSRGRITEFYIEFKYTAEQAVDRFGSENLSPELNDEARAGSLDTHTFIFYIGKNYSRDERSKLAKHKKFTGQWIDLEGQREVQSGGYDESPAVAHRFYKRGGSTWGISPAMKALSDVRGLNAQVKTMIRAMMKHTDTPIAIPDDAFLSAYNGNPHGINYYQAGKLSKDDIIPLGGFGNPQYGMDIMEYSVSRVKAMMFTDVFIAFDGITKQMNNPEVMERIAEKMTLLGPAAGRMVSEVLDPIIHRVFAMLLRSGKLGDIPKELLDNPTYEIDYISSLALSQRNGELQSLNNAMNLIGAMAQMDPSVLDKIDPDKGVDVIWSITGAPIHMLREDDEVDQLRESRAKQQEQEKKAALMNQGADTAVKASLAQKNMQEQPQE